MKQPLTLEQAQAVFAAMAACGDAIAFGWLREGCECRAQLMIERMQTMGLAPGRAWAIAVGRPLLVPDPDERRCTYTWWNHVAPTLSVEGVAHGVLVIDPALSRTGPFSLVDWAAAMNARSVEISDIGLAQADILSRHAARALKGETLDAVVLHLKLGQAPIPEAGGTGFIIGRDPEVGISVYAHEAMQGYLAKQKQRRPRRR